LEAPREAIAEEGLPTSERREYVFTKAELDDAALLRLMISRALLLGVRLGEVRSARTREILPLRQLVATEELPPWTGWTTGGERGDRACRVCNRDGYFDSGEDPFGSPTTARGLIQRNCRM
jgi:hypothetical protein